MRSIKKNTKIIKRREDYNHS
uniref:Uncharacterized protein n=1 Tax=Vitis vinifera TaxID=29760 RepID=F6HTL6_VITVI